MLLKRRKEKEQQPVMPTIQFNPEFNFGSKNQDNDQVQDGGVLNQNSSGTSNKTEDNDQENKALPEVAEAEVYDPYDDVVTKDEVIDAIIEKDPEKLKMLYDQEMLNRRKEELKKKDKKEKKGE